MRLAAGANRLAQAGVAAPLGSGGVTRNTTFGFITSKCRVRHAAASVVTLAATTPSSGAGSRRAAARRAEDRRLMAAILHGHDRLVRRREGRNSKPRDYPGSLPLEAAIRNCQRILRQSERRGCRGPKQGSVG